MIYVLFALIGLSMGSFGNVLIMRLPYKQGVLMGRSYCPNCGHMIKWYENVPLVSYLLLQGKCSGCSKHISAQYPIVEMSVGLLFVLTAFYHIDILPYFTPALLLRDIVFIYFMFILAYIDIWTSMKEEFDYLGEVPNSLAYVACMIGLISIYYAPASLVDAVIGGIFGYSVLYIPTLLFYLFTKKVGMGEGDFRIMAIVGIFYGVKAVAFTVFFGACFAGVGALIFRIVQMFMPSHKSLANKAQALPFVPFLAIASVLYIFLGNNIINVYMNYMY